MRNLGSGVKTSMWLVCMHHFLFAFLLGSCKGSGDPMYCCALLGLVVQSRYVECRALLVAVGDLVLLSGCELIVRFRSEIAAPGHEWIGRLLCRAEMLWCMHNCARVSLLLIQVSATTCLPVRRLGVSNWRVKINQPACKTALVFHSHHASSAH